MFSWNKPSAADLGGNAYRKVISNGTGIPSITGTSLAGFFWEGGWPPLSGVSPGSSSPSQPGRGHYWARRSKRGGQPFLSSLAGSDLICCIVWCLTGGQEGPTRLSVCPSFADLDGQTDGQVGSGMVRSPLESWRGLVRSFWLPVWMVLLPGMEHRPTASPTLLPFLFRMSRWQRTTAMVIVTIVCRGHYNYFPKQHQHFWKVDFSVWKHFIFQAGPSLWSVQLLNWLLFGCPLGTQPQWGPFLDRGSWVLAGEEVAAVWKGEKTNEKSTEKRWSAREKLTWVVSGVCRSIHWI